MKDVEKKNVFLLEKQKKTESLIAPHTFPPHLITDLSLLVNMQMNMLCFSCLTGHASHARWPFCAEVACDWFQASCFGSSLLVLLLERSERNDGPTTEG